METEATGQESHAVRCPHSRAPVGLGAIHLAQAAFSLYEQIQGSILEAICGGPLRPGDRLNHDELAEPVNVSRQPVTHALRLYWHHLRHAMLAVVEPPQACTLVWDEHEGFQEAAQRVMQRLPEPPTAS